MRDGSLAYRIDHLPSFPTGVSGGEGAQKSKFFRTHPDTTSDLENRPSTARTPVSKKNPIRCFQLGDRFGAADILKAVNLPQEKGWRIWKGRGVVVCEKALILGRRKIKKYLGFPPPTQIHPSFLPTFPP